MLKKPISINLEVFPKFWVVIVFLIENIQVEKVSHCLELGKKKICIFHYLRIKSITNTKWISKWIYTSKINGYFDTNADLKLFMPGYIYPPFVFAEYKCIIDTFPMFFFLRKLSSYQYFFRGCTIWGVYRSTF